MDQNLLHWKSLGKSFLQRVRIWFDLLDPTLLLCSDPEIQNAHTLIGSEKTVNPKDLPALTISLSSVHADSGAPLPLLFRPPALYPVAVPLVLGSLLPHTTVKFALGWQFMLQSYCAGFNFANRNSSAEQGKKVSLNQFLLVAGTISYTTCAGALPQIFIRQLAIRNPSIQTFFKSILPIPLSAALAFFSVITVRSEESETGIQVFNSNGNPVGISKAAGEKAVRETALSRALLFGTTAAVPNIMDLLLKRARFFQRNPGLFASLRHLHIAFVLCVMIPVSFSIVSPLGTIKREQLEEELLPAALGSQLFYHRGL